MVSRSQPTSDTVERSEMVEALANQRRRMGAEYDELAVELKRVRSVAAERIQELEAELASCRACREKIDCLLRGER
jgi:hypothetical protein